MSTSPTSEIPRTFHRIWLGSADAFPPIFQKWWDDLKVLHPDWEFITWTDCLDVEDAQHPTKALGHRGTSRLANVYSNLGKPVLQSDLLRILVLLRYGGIYVDCDMEVRKPLDEIVEGMSAPTGVFIEYPKIMGVTNALIISQRQAFYLSELLREALTNLESYEAGDARSPIHLSGPGLFTKVLKDFSETEVEILDQSKFLMGSKQVEGSHVGMKDRANASRLNPDFDVSQYYAVHHLCSSWVSYGSKKTLGLETK